MEKLKCPYCGREEDDWWGYTQVCGGCEKRFAIEKQVVVTYNTTRISCYEDGGKHDYSIEGFSVEKTLVDDGMWIEVADEKDWNYFRVKCCSVCDDEEYISITRDEYLKGKK